MKQEKNNQKIVSLRLSPYEYQLLKEHADKQAETISRYIKHALADSYNKNEKGLSPDNKNQILTYLIQIKKIIQNCPNVSSKIQSEIERRCEFIWDISR